MWSVVLKEDLQLGGCSCYNVEDVKAKVQLEAGLE